MEAVVHNNPQIPVNRHNIKPHDPKYRETFTLGELWDTIKQANDMPERTIKVEPGYKPVRAGNMLLLFKEPIEVKTAEDYRKTPISERVRANLAVKSEPKQKKKITWLKRIQMLLTKLWLPSVYILKPVSARTKDK